MVDEMPWEGDIHGMNSRISAAEKETLAVMDRNPDERLEESFQHLRLTVSNWMKNTSEGANVREQIELLRKARNRLPLFELRRRADILLYPYVKKMLRVGRDEPDESMSILRRDCLQIKQKESCGGMCSWSSDGDRCLIHTTKTQRFVDPVYVLAAKLVDELLRTHTDARQVLDNKVPRLRKPDGILRDADFITTSFEGRGDEVLEGLGLDRARFKSKYARGLVFPEQTGLAEVATLESLRGVSERWEGIQKPVLGAEAARDRSMRLKIVWISVFDGSHWKDIESLFKPDIDYKKIANRAGVNVLTTEFPPSAVEMEVAAWFSPEKEAGSQERRFVIVDPEGIPLQDSETGLFVFEESTLPLAIREWLDSHTSR
jgi:hypothetical protein